MQASMHNIFKANIFVILIYVSLWSVSFSKKHKRPEYCKNVQGDEDGSFLWEVQRHPPSYFFGTIHVPYTRVWDYIPENAKKAFILSDSVFFELDLTDSFTIAALTSCQLLPKGDNLSEVLPKDLFKRLRRHLAYVKSEMPSWITDDQRKKGLNAEYLFNAITGNWQRKRPVWVMLMVNSLTEGDIRSRGVPVLDLYLAQMAEKQKKFISAVERVHEQCVPLNKLNLSQGVFALDHTLSQQESLRVGTANAVHSTDSLIQHYNCGSLDPIFFSQDSTQASSLTVPHLSNSSMPPTEAEAAQKIDEYFREALIYQRNERMGRRVAKIMQDNPNESFFFAFGAGHFLGNHSVLDVVRSHGFQINHVPPDKKIRRRKRKQKVNKSNIPQNSGGGFLPKLSILRNFTFGSRNLQPDNQIDPAFARFLSERQNGRFVIKDFRGVPTPPTTPRPFNDLWVRIETDSQKASSSAKQNNDMEVIGESLRVWYGLPTTSNALSHNCQPSIITTIAIILYIYNVMLRYQYKL